MTLKQRLESACAFDAHEAKIITGKEYAVMLRSMISRTSAANSGIGLMRQENARLKPLLTALIDVAEAAESMVNGASLYDGVERVDKALNRLEKLCGEGE